MSNGCNVMLQFLVSQAQICMEPMEAVRAAGAVPGRWGGTRCREAGSRRAGLLAVL